MASADVKCSSSLNIEQSDGSFIDVSIGIFKISINTKLLSTYTHNDICESILPTIFRHSEYLKYSSTHEI